ncbi:hypothetical protein OPW36_11265 [Vibrio europaeus]|uniref:hypothetical protein n=1 Tax=Vibrio europaeus TaxID=300876 RepID=UPI00233F6092|nr:hypothetical protein [Vibrio europaeus]MDC5808008.1 hypothetical protein [Vibrio europaeus]MDC5825291.1 hypothetical protein [Vibrio europaeus]MDC5830834.1 hypothetical protein [Vibrio europaeus]MDC5833789.1 hypothetical protein [Vibrio europaeus]
MSKAPTNPPDTLKVGTSRTKLCTQWQGVTVTWQTSDKSETVNTSLSPCRVRCFRSSTCHRYLCCTRPRTKVDRAIYAGQLFSSHADPLKQPGYFA